MKDVAMMCHFARRKLQRMFGDVMESGSGLEIRQRVLDFITWDSMISHWDETGGHQQCSLQNKSYKDKSRLKALQITV